VVETVRLLLVWVGFEVPLVLPEPLHPARSAVAPSMKLIPHFCMAVLSSYNSADGKITQACSNRFSHVFRC